MLAKKTCIARAKKNQLKFIVIIFSLTLIQTTLFAQSTLKGKITESKNKSALPGASVYIPDIKPYFIKLKMIGRKFMKKIRICGLRTFKKNLFTDGSLDLH